MKPDGPLARDRGGGRLRKRSFRKPALANGCSIFRKPGPRRRRRRGGGPAAAAEPQESFVFSDLAKSGGNCRIERIFNLMCRAWSISSRRGRLPGRRSRRAWSRPAGLRCRAARPFPKRTYRLRLRLRIRRFIAVAGLFSNAACSFKHRGQSTLSQFAASRQLRERG